MVKLRQGTEVDYGIHVYPVGVQFRLSFLSSLAIREQYGDYDHRSSHCPGTATANNRRYVIDGVLKFAYFSAWRVLANANLKCANVFLFYKILPQIMCMKLTIMQQTFFFGNKLSPPPPHSY